MWALPQEEIKTLLLQLCPSSVLLGAWCCARWLQGFCQHPGWTWTYLAVLSAAGPTDSSPAPASTALNESCDLGNNFSKKVWEEEASGCFLSLPPCLCLLPWVSEHPLVHPAESPAAAPAQALVSFSSEALDLALGLKRKANAQTYMFKCTVQFS